MKLKENIDMIAFMDKTKQCHGDIYFHTSEGDSLNLKSTLCQLIMATLLSSPKLLYSGEIICTEDADYNTLQDFTK